MCAAQVDGTWHTLGLTASASCHGMDATYVLVAQHCQRLGCNSSCVQDEKEGTDLGVLKNVMAHNWIEPSKRERKRVLNYSEADYYKQVG